MQSMRIMYTNRYLDNSIWLFQQVWRLALNRMMNIQITLELYPFHLAEIGIYT